MHIRLDRSIVILLLIGSLGAAGCGSSRTASAPESGQSQATGLEQAEPLLYTIDLSELEADLFRVTLEVDDLGDANAVYQFASTAPGTYQVHDIGRYVRDFSAFSEDGRAIPTTQISTNQWRIDAPASVDRITYSISETWDTPVEKHSVYPMSGTSIEADHALINGHAVIGYPTGMQARPIELRVIRANEWMVGTALETDADGDFLADDYDHLVDSPILMGRLSRASLDVQGSKVDIYTYSKTDKVHSDQILVATRDILLSAGEFLDGLPVDRYVFLFHFEDVSIGAWEHSYSSGYVLAEASFEQEIQELIPDIVAHEFFHIVTPLNIHSEIVEQFNFVKPVPSEHLWLYEGTTEWAAHIMQLRSNLITLEEYLDRMSRKLQTDEAFDEDYSLSQLSMTSYTDAGARQYGNIYMRGALVSGLLDLRLLELSGGTSGLREVLEELSEKYGPDRAFDEESFFDEFTEMTYPEIADFFDRYVRDAEPLPIAEYYGNVGITYNPTLATGEMVASSGVQLMFDGEGFIIAGVNEHAASCGFAGGDRLVAYNAEEVTLQNIQQVVTQFHLLDAEVPYELTVQRGNEQHTVECRKTMNERIERHVFTIDDVPTPDQLALREAWMRNLEGMP